MPTWQVFLNSRWMEINKSKTKYLYEDRRKPKQRKIEIGKELL